MEIAPFYPRFAMARLEEAMADSPIALIHGPRQCGKTTLARAIGVGSNRTYLSFDDPIALAAARSDPAGFVADLPATVTLDEVQRVPELFPVLKAAVDRDRRPGSFLLTGSANVMLLPSLSESLAGRMEIVRLHPLAQSELAGTQSMFLETLLGCGVRAPTTGRMGTALIERVVAGGFPAALARPNPRRRQAWYRDYLEALVQRDVRELARIRSLDALPRLLALAAGQTARLLNVSDLSGPFQLTRPTIREYVTLLQRVFLLDELPPWHSNRMNRLVKTPKLHMGDTGLASTLLGASTESLARDRECYGQLLETFVFQELRRLSSWYEGDVRFFHYRDKDGYEVDIVLELGMYGVAGVEVKASGTVTAADFRGLRRFKQVAGDRFVAGVLLYDGDVRAGFGDGLIAMPMAALWA